MSPRLSDNPCKPDCPDRHTGCHAGCRRYAAYDRENRRRRAEHLRAGEARDYALKAALKICRRRHK